MRCVIRAEGPEARARFAPLFDGWEETPVWSALEGLMGSVYGCAETGETPEAGVCWNGDLLFFAGDPASRGASELAEAFRGWLGNRYGILVPRTPSWDAPLLKAFGSRARRSLRYAMQKEGDLFDRDRLKAMAAKTPEGVELRRIDRELYTLALEAEWSRDLCSQFASAEAYEAQGLGVAALENGELVGGASSYICYRGGIEIEVDTRADRRRRGIAAACCARLILRCLARGLYPSWDAANRASVALAEKLGYHEAGEYPVFEVNAPE